MCLLILCYRIIPGVEIALAMNRDERYDRPSAPPQLSVEGPKILAPRDERAGGTWIGINEYGLVVAVLNRRDVTPQPALRSRGTLCRDLLGYPTTMVAARAAREELSSGQYAGVQVFCIDRVEAVHSIGTAGGGTIGESPIAPGTLTVLANDPHHVGDERRVECARRHFRNGDCLSSSENFVTGARQLLSRGPEWGQRSVLKRKIDRGTVSASIIVFSTKHNDLRYLYSNGPPDRVPFVDYAALLQAAIPFPSTIHPMGANL